MALVIHPDNIDAWKNRGFALYNFKRTWMRLPRMTGPLPSIPVMPMRGSSADWQSGNSAGIKKRLPCMTGPLPSTRMRPRRKRTGNRTKNLPVSIPFPTAYRLGWCGSRAGNLAVIRGKDVTEGLTEGGSPPLKYGGPREPGDEWFEKKGSGNPKM